MRSLPVGDPGSPDHRSPARFLLWLAAQAWPTLAGGAGLGIVWMVSQALMPAVVGKAIDAGVRARDLDALTTWGTVLLGLGLVQAAAGIARHRTRCSTGLPRPTAPSSSPSSRPTGSAPRYPRDSPPARCSASAPPTSARSAGPSTSPPGALVAIVTVTVILLSISVPLDLVVVFGVPVLLALVGGLIQPLHRRQQA